MDLRQLRYFISVVDERGFRRAAEALSVAQPALSRQIKILEGELAVTLLERDTHGIALTEAGQSLLRDAREILERVALATERARAIDRGQSGVLKIAVSESGAVTKVFSAIIESFRARYPDVELVMTGLDSKSQMAALRSGLLDVGFVQDLPDEEDIFERIAVYAQPVMAAVPADHRLAKKRRLVVADFENVPMIWSARGFNNRLNDNLLKAFMSGGVTPIVAHEVSPGAIVLSLVSARMGVGIVLAEVPWQIPAGVVCKPIDDLAVSVQLELVWRRDNKSPALLRFVENAQQVRSRFR